uniref:F-box domain-containing protein n=1 Tax=Ditylenchus dipsaci TaxID=166011 RepID=A0A915DHA3_9BILA
MSSFLFEFLFTALPPTKPYGSVTAVSSLFKQEILHEMLAFCSRPELELCSIYSSTFHQLVKNHFPTAPYRCFHQLHISTSQGTCGLIFCKEKNQTFRLFKNNAKTRRNQKQRGEQISYDTPFHMLYPYLKSAAIRLQEVTLNMDKGGFTPEVQQQLKCLAHLWVSSKFTLQVTQLSKLESSSQEYHNLLKEVFLSGLLNCSQLVLKFNFPTIQLKMDWAKYEGFIVVMY